jgi:hypothetical protein
MAEHAKAPNSYRKPKLTQFAMNSGGRSVKLRLASEAGRQPAMFQRETLLLKAILTDPQFWIPLVILAIGITLLACLR